MRKLFLVFISLSFSYLNAQDFEVSPVSLFFNAEPGESQSKFINIKNHSSKAETFILTTSDYSVDSKGKGSYVEAGSLKQSVANLISISPSFFELQPNEEKQVNITLQQPIDDFGSKWGVVFVKTAKEQEAFSVDKGVSAGVSLSARIAVDVFQTPGNNKSFKATISNLSEISNDTDSLRVFTAIVNNLSEIITECKVMLIATNIETAEETNFKEEKFMMFPKSSRKIELELPNNLSKGTYSLAAILDYGSRTNLEGTQMIIKVE